MQLTKNFSDDREPAINDRGQIVFMCSVNSDDEICVINSDRSGFRKITNNPYINYSHPIITEMGSVLFECDRLREGRRLNICGYTEDQGLQTLAPQNVHELDRNLSSDGSDQLHFNCRENSAGICQVAFNQSGEFGDIQFRGSGKSAVANQTGTIVFLCLNSDNSVNELCVQKNGESKLINLKISVNLPSQMSIDINNLGQIVFHCIVGSEERTDICMINSDGSQFRLLTNNQWENQNPKLNDSGQVVFDCHEATVSNLLDIRNREICAIRIDGSGYKILTERLLGGFAPSINNKGEVAYSCIDTEPEICVTNFNVPWYTSIERFSNISDAVIEERSTLDNLICGEQPGNLVRTWGSKGSGPGEFNFEIDTNENAHPFSGIAIDEDRNILVADSNNHRIQKFSPIGEFLMEWGSEGELVGMFRHPSGIAIDTQGNVYVADSINDRIQIFTPFGDFLREIKYRETTFDSIWQINNFALDGSNTIYADRFERLVVIENRGFFLTKWGEPGTAPGRFFDPRGIAINNSNQIFISDATNNRIQKFSNEGSLMSSWGSYGFGPGQFDGPQGITISPNGSVYVADTKNHRIQKFSETGDFNAEWGSIGSLPGALSFPRGIAVDEDNQIYVVDAGNNRIQVYCDGT